MLNSGEARSLVNISKLKGIFLLACCVLIITFSLVVELIWFLVPTYCEARRVFKCSYYSCKELSWTSMRFETGICTFNLNCVLSWRSLKESLLEFKSKRYYEVRFSGSVLVTALLYESGISSEFRAFFLALFISACNSGTLNCSLFSSKAWASSYESTLLLDFGLFIELPFRLSFAFIYIWLLSDPQDPIRSILCPIVNRFMRFFVFFTEGLPSWGLNYTTSFPALSLITWGLRVNDFSRSYTLAVCGTSRFVAKPPVFEVEFRPVSV